MKYNIFSWNINQATDVYGRNRIPNFVGEMIIEKKPDLIVLTEFCFCKNAKEFLETLEKQGYDFFPKEDMYDVRDKQNIVLLAWKKDCFEPVARMEEAAWHALTTNSNNVPNFARVGLKDKNGQEFTFVGVRITMALKITARKDEEELQKLQYQKQAKLRQEQMNYVLQALEGIPKVIIAGDFNNYRRGTSLEWNVTTLNCGLPFKIYTPDGQSIYAEYATAVDYEFAEDHFMAKGCAVSAYHYDRSFTNKYPEVYLYGKNFSIYKPSDENWSIRYGSGYPDHAILIGELELNESFGDTYICSRCG